MSNTERRQSICQHCILVKGFHNEANFNLIRGIFSGAIRGEVVARTSSFEHDQREWIIYFSSPNDTQGYIDERIHKTTEGILEISTCELPCDIPDEWLQETNVNTVPGAPPSYSAFDPNLYQHGDPTAPPPKQSSMGQPGFPPNYDPRYFQQFMHHPGQNPQNPNQPPFPPPQWPQFQQGPQSGSDNKRAQGPPPGYWQGPDGGYYPYPPSGYPGYPPYGFPGYGYQQPPGQPQQPPGQPYQPPGQPQLPPGQPQQPHQDERNPPGDTTEPAEDNIKRSTDDENISETDEPEEEPEEEPKKATTYMLKVTKLPSGTTEDSLEFFFENTRKFGGGDVEEIDYDEETSTAIITFKDDDAVEKVLQKMPILFRKKIIEVEAYSAHVEPPLDIAGEKFYDCTDDPHEQEATCTIEVRGMKPSTTDDTIMYYFESRKGANADVENIEFDEEKNRYLVTFEEEKAVSRALEKSHVVDGATLQVKKHVPPKRYPNKVLVKGLSEKTSKDGLINFLEARTKKDVETVDFGDEDSRKAIVTFSEPVDVSEIQTVCKKKALEGNTLTIHPVVVTNCIIVRGYSEKTTESSLEYYFDNRRKSGVEGVTEIKMNHDEDNCVLYFEDPKDALIACQRTHMVDKCTLQVQVFYDCLGIPAGDEGPKFKPLAPIIIDNLEIRKIQFLLHSVQSKADIEEQLSNMHARIIWPEKRDQSHLKIECTLTKDTKDCRKLAKTWGEDVRKKTLTFMDVLANEKHAPLQTAFDQVLQKLRDVNIPNPDGVCVSVEKAPVCEIYIVGQQSSVREVSDMVKTIIDEVTKDMDRKKQQIQEDVTLKHHQLLILAFTQFQDKMKGMFDNMEIKIDIKKHAITFIGISGDVTSVKVKMFETLNNIVSANIGKKSHSFFQFLKNPHVKAHLGKKIKDRGIVGVWDIHDSSVVMYSMSDEDAVDASTIFKEAVIETKVDIDNLRQSLLQSPKWNQLVKSIEDDSQQKSVITKIIVDRQGQIILLCTDKGEAGLIRERIQDFFLFNTENETTIGLPAAQLKFLQEHMKDEVDRLESQLKRKNIIIAVKSDGILVKGNKQGIEEAEEEIGTLVEKIYKTTHSIDKPGISELMETSQGKQKLKQVSKQAGVVISSESDEDEKSAGRGIRARSSINSSDGTVYNTVGGQEVIVVKGDITGLDVDVIVNAANKDLVHSGGLAKALINKGGKKIQTECDQYTSFNGQLAEGDVFCSGPGTLNCKVIIHAVGPIWQGGGNQEEDLLCRCVESSLDETEKKGLTSIAFPALCTGIFGYPAIEATRVIAEAVRDYFRGNQSSSIQTVYLCDINDKSVNFFDKAGSKLFSKGGGSKTPRRGQQGRKHSGGPSDKDEHHVTAGNIQIKIVKAELAKMKVDAIVNTTSRDLQLQQGAVSASLSKAAGPKLQQECSKSFPNGVDYGEVAVTSGANLSCRIVCHGSLDQWRRDGSSIKVLEKFVMGCLGTANGKGCQSIALPAMGTGKLGYPRDLVAKQMFTCVEIFATQNPRSSITDVMFVLYDKDIPTVKAFEDEERSRSKASHVRYDMDFTEAPTTHQGRAKQGKKKPQQQTQQKTPTPQAQATMDANKEYSVSMGNLVFKVYQGDITAVKVDAIVNGANSDLDLSVGAVSRAIKTKGGQELEKQLKEQRDVMKKDKIAVTKVKKKTAKGLMCDAVIHIDMTGIHTTGVAGGLLSAFYSKLKDRVKQALDKSEELHLTTIAFPALGTSTNYAKIPISDNAEEMFRVVEKFANNPNTKMKEVHVVIFQADMMKEFMEAIQKCVNNSPTDKGYFGKLKQMAGFGSVDKPTKVSRHERRLVGAQVSVDRTAPTGIKLVIYARDKGTADRAIKMLEQLIDADTVEKTVKAKIIKDLDKDQFAMVMKIEESGRVKVTVDTQMGEIKLRGLMNNVSDAVGLANDIVRSAELSKQTKQKAKLVLDMVQWFYIEVANGNKKLVEYPPDVNLILESALKEQKTEAYFYDKDRNKYIIDLNAYEEYPADDPNDKVQVLRKSKLLDQTFEPPLIWEPMDDKENLTLVLLKTDSKEYKDVTSKFTSSAGGYKLEFVKVERVQNKTLYQQYVAKKKSMDATNPKGHQNERELWHGFSVDALDSICRYGFNRGYCGKNATALGAGVYFAVNTNYSLSDTYSRPDAQGHKRMFLCNVLTGQYCVGNSQLKVPPVKPGAAGSHILYDTVTNDPNNPIMFVIFHDSQAVPEYLVTFKRK